MGDTMATGQAIHFRARLQAKDESVFIELPSAVLTRLGSLKRPPVLLTLNGYEYRTRVAVYGGRSLRGVHRDRPAAAAGRDSHAAGGRAAGRTASSGSLRSAAVHPPEGIRWIGGGGKARGDAKGARWKGDGGAVKR